MFNGGMMTTSYIIIFSAILYLFYRRRSALRKLKTARERYELLFENSRLGVYEWRYRQGHTELIWSRRMYSLLKLNPKSFQPSLENFLELVHPEDREKILCDKDGTRLAEKSQHIEYRLRIENDYHWVCSRTAVRHDENGKFLFGIGSMEDIQESKQSKQLLEEEVRKRTLQLELANVTKDRFLANMSHELRTPLGLILGFSELLSENRTLDPEGREYIDLIVKNGEILSRLINDLLDLSRVEAGKLKFQWSQIHFQSLIQEIQNTFAEKAARKKIELRFSNCLPSTEMILTDPIRLKQIIYNLLSNAIKFTDSGAVTIIFNRGSGVREYQVDVMDTGIGVDESEKQKIFMEYHRSDLVEDRKYPGFGLGLKLAKNLCQAMGGDLQLVSSAVRQGSHFRAVFCGMCFDKLKHSHPQALALPMGVEFSQLRIGVLDDNEDNLKLAQIFLKKIGCRVWSWTDPEIFLRECPLLNLELVLMDIQMPKMSGIEVLGLLREQGFKNPVWALTAYGMNDDVQRILEKGFQDFIRKPIHMENFKIKLVQEFKEPLLLPPVSNFQ